MIGEEVRTIRPDRDCDKQQQTRRRLLAEARRIFLKVGYRGTTLDDIATAAGFTKGAVYWHFPNKRALFLALVAESVAENLDVLGSFLALGAADPQLLKRKLGAWIDTIDERESLAAFGVELEIEARHDPELRALHQQMVAGHEARLADFLDRYFRLVGDSPTIPPQELARALITVFKGFALSRYNRPIDPPNSAKTVRLLMRLPVGGEDRANGPA